MRADIERQKPARARAGQIRAGIGEYLKTLAVIAQAYAEQDHITLGYESWQAYIDSEFGAERLKLDPAHREKAVTELRLAGLSQRAIGTALGVSQPTVSRVLAGDSFESPAEEEDAGQPVVDALKQAIVDAGERNEAATADRVGPAVASPDTANRPGPAETGATGAGSAPAPVADTTDPGVAAPAEEADVPAASSRASSGPEPATPPAGEGEQGGPATSPAGPSCEKCGTDISDDGYRRCADCDPDGMHTAADDGACRLCALLATVPDEYLPIQVGEGVHGLQLECRCGAVVSHLKAGMPLGIALVEAHLHAGSCNGSTP
jgi:predicted XRE-type DNA-binding protein